VDGDALADDAVLEKWVARAAAFAETLPAK